MGEDKEPDWLAELARGGDEVRRQIELLVQGAKQFVRDNQQAIGNGGPVPPFQQRLVRAVGAAVRELGPARQPVKHAMVFPTTVYGSASAAGVGTITATGNVVFPPMRVSSQGAVQDPARGQAERGIGYILALMLVAFVGGGLLGVPESDRAAMDHYLAVIGVLLPIAILIWTSWNKQK